MPSRIAKAAPVALVMVAVIWSGVAALQARSTDMQNCKLMFSSGVSLSEIPNAVSLQQIERGLSNRDDVRPGMLFSWPVADYRAFWMKNTYVPLSIGFFDDAGRLFQIENMEAFSEVPHYSNETAKHALELPAGDFERLGLILGDRFESVQCK